MSSGSWKRPGRPGNGLSPTNRSWANGPIGDRLMDILRKRLEKGIKTTPAAFKKEADGAEFKNYHTKTLGVVINEMLRKLQRGQSFQDGSLFGMQPLAPVDFNAGSSSNLQQSVADSNENDKDFENEMDEDFDEEFYGLRDLFEVIAPYEINGRRTMVIFVSIVADYEVAVDPSAKSFEYIDFLHTQTRPLCDKQGFY
ncbi:hypothetical protein BCR33DRAFT_792204 [Rhizoclosmatium globosum]|uniref:Uncharacterized protein n=1 Tax=Rhizoclosmatium globosum TaxID=329046 RepID=A0A1Y2BAA7_9FUNG|nr:hypothetical protein BCR33DRAFT_792204 [Rhizoclosmatium globosum]|eukprot:ORY31450.1 hypothetical protein BCR33DRAFT_792204 [Rhizoclosmatium globosum]